MKLQIIILLLLSLTIARKPFSSKHQSLPTQPTSFPEANILSLQQSSGSGVSANKNAKAVLERAKESSTGTPLRSIDSLFSRLPSSDELDELILSADSAAILKTVQTLASDDSIPCSQIVNYLLELIGRIRAAIQLKQFHADQVKVVIDGAEQEIERLEDQIQRLQDEKKALWLDQLRDRLMRQIRNLQKAFNEFNSVEFQIAPNEAKVAGYEKEIRILTKRSDEERNRIANDKLKLSQTQAEIRSLQVRLSNAKIRKNNLESNIRKSQNIIADNDKRINVARAHIRSLEEKIHGLKDKSDDLRRKSVELQIKVQRLRTDIAVAENRIDRINSYIDNLNRRINIEERKLAYDDLKDLNEMISSLKRSSPHIERQIDRQYYYCYGDGAIKVQKTGDVVVYIVRGESFAHYLLNAYGKSVNGLRKDNYKLHKIDIFSAIWTVKFGYPPVISDSGSMNDFSCLKTSIVSRQGKIKEVHANSMVVSHDDGESVLHLGTCSRLEGTQELPIIGQNIMYKGSRTSDGYNLISGTCW